MSLNGFLSYDTQIQYAETRITAILNDYLIENENNQNASWYAIVKAEIPAFQAFLAKGKNNGINIDQIKEHVLIMAHKFTALLPRLLGFQGNSDLKENLITEVNKWPTFLVLTEINYLSLFCEHRTLQGKILELEAELQTKENKIKDLEDTNGRLLKSNASLLHDFKKYIQEHRNQPGSNPPSEENSNNKVYSLQ